ncbi:MAG: hypothetical protein JSU61_11120 [Fidelibacterota bacterium]|nr:MAG: hypothetical protein JSU61_11120 [Candidatus Neomarinimicrobiota bacterium]
MRLRYNWDEIRKPEERFRLLNQYFHSAPAPPNRAVLNLVMGSVEVVLHVDEHERFVGYEVGRFGVVWICSKCRATVTLQDLKEFKSEGEICYLEHEPECG